MANEVDHSPQFDASCASYGSADVGRRTPLRAVALTAVVVGALFAAAFVVVVGLLSDSADAHDVCDPGAGIPWVDEEEMIHNCIDNFLYDPGAGQLLEDADLTETVVSYFDALGFDRDWVWFSPRTSNPDGKVAISQSTNWAYCPGPVTSRIAGELCSSTTPAFAALDPSFTGSAPVRLSVIGDSQTFIARGCGNVSRDEPTVDYQVFVEAFKFHDFDRDGGRDAGEPGLGGWTFDLERDQSFIGQSPGATGLSFSSSSAPGSVGNVSFEFTAFDQLGPGVYRLVERNQSGWTATGGDFLEFRVDFGIGDATIDAGDIGNARTEADVEKVDFRVAPDFPASIPARTPTEIAVEVLLRNNGPAELVRVRDTVRISGGHIDGTDDCTFDATERSIGNVLLRRGQTSSPIQFTFTVTCDKPSFHDFTFYDELTVTTPGVSDPDLGNNTLSFTHRVPVEANTDFSVTAAIDCPGRTDVDTDTTCDVTLDFGAHGYGPAEGQVDWTVTGPADCTIDPSGGSQTVELRDDESATIAVEHLLNCADRSFHDFVVNATVAPVDIHVHDLEPGNDLATDNDRIEVFEAADLAVIEADLWLSCDEYFGPVPFTCDAVVPVTNLGTAPDVVTVTTASLGGADCVASPNPQSAVRAVDVGQTVDIEFQWSVECGDPTVVHVLYLDVCVTNDPSDPHAEDREPSNNCGRVAAVPIDFKPLSDPNTVNLRRGGLTSVAILSSPTFDPITEVDTTQPITFGPTGTEATATRCATEGEDANADGYDRDLTCKFRNSDLGLAAGDERVYLIGYLTDGTRFIGTEQVRVI